MHIRCILRLVTISFLTIAPGAAMGETLSVVSSADGGEGSLRAAIDLAEAGDVIEIAIGESPILLTLGELTISKSVTVRAASDRATIDAQETSRIFVVEGAETVVAFEKLKLLNGKLPDGESGESNTPTPGDAGNGEHGGAITISEADVRMTDCELSGHRAGSGGIGGTGGSGGAVYQNGGSLTLENCSFISNAAGKGGDGSNSSGRGIPGFGGSIAIKNAELEISECDFAFSYAGSAGLDNVDAIVPEDAIHGFGLPKQGGGAVFAGASTVAILHSSFSDCRAFSGGALSLEECEVELSSSSLTGNRTWNGGFGQGLGGRGGDGGGLNANGGILSIDACQFLGNQASYGSFGGGSGGSGGSGGAIAALATTTSIEKSLFADNRAGDGGSGNENSGSGGSGGAIDSTGPMTILRSTITGNRAGDGWYGGDGGGIRSGGDLELRQSSIINNVSGEMDFSGPFLGESGQGGGVSGTGVIRLVQVTVVGNRTKGSIYDGASGGGIHGSNEISVRNSIIWGNQSPDGPDISGNSIADGVNLVGDLGGSGLVEGPNLLVSVNPVLAPLGDYGGPTPTIPPLPESPIIDIADGADASEEDQRGLARVVGGGPDLGAVEFAGTFDVLLIWEVDPDDDGLPYGVELGTGSDPLKSDRSESIPTSLSLDGEAVAEFRFTLDWAVRDQVAWVVYRGESPGTGSEIFRLFGPTGEETSIQGITAERDDPAEPSMIRVTEPMPSAGRAFYWLGVEYVPPPTN